MDHGNILNLCLISVLSITESVRDYFQEKDLYVCYGAVTCAW